MFPVILLLGWALSHKTVGLSPLSFRSPRVYIYDSMHATPCMKNVKHYVNNKSFSIFQFLSHCYCSSSLSLTLPFITHCGNAELQKKY